MASSCVVFRLAKSIQEVAEAAKPERESCLVRAGRIAAHYWDDPAKWAAQDPYGKGVLTCLRAVDADYPLGTSPWCTRPSTSTRRTCRQMG